MSQLIHMSLNAPEETLPFKGGTGQLNSSTWRKGPYVERLSGRAGEGHSTSSRSPGPTAAKPPISGTSSPAG